MTEVARKWEPVADIDIPFGSIWYSYSGDSLTATLRGSRSLSLRFSGVVALRFELECPGFNPLPKPFPMLRPGATFPLLVVEQSRWLEQYEPIYQGRRHFALVSSDDLVQLIANPQVIAQWE
jgi:hypothetical protein